MNIAQRLNEHLPTWGFASKVARMSGVGRDTVVRIATGQTPNPGIETVAAIAKVLDRLFPPDKVSEEKGPE